MRLQNDDLIPQLVQAQGLGVALTSWNEWVLIGLPVCRSRPSFVEAKRELAFDIANGAGGQQPQPNVGNTLDIFS